jgi:hypothetical protein
VVAVKKWVWKEAAEVIGVLGIIAGIVFLGYELRQNNQLLEEQARYSMLENQKDWTFFLAGEGDVSRLVFNSTAINELTELERYRRDEILVGILFAWQWEYQQALSGFLTMAEMPIEAYRYSWTVYNIDSVWQNAKAQFSPEFSEFVEARIRN